MLEEKKMPDQKQIRTGFVPIDQNLLISHPDLGVKARVLQPFYIEVKPAGNEFVAVSDISDIFETGKTANDAVLSCLYSLVDELIWYRERQQSLSGPMLKDLDKLQFYLDVA